jgi:prepilin-type N-terminal cleavage/methylation domain-containing protein
MTNQNGQGQVLGGQAPSESAKLRAKQGHATSAKHDRFSAFSFLKFRIPHFAFPNKIPPSRLYPDSVGALRPLREIFGFTLIELMAATTVLSIILLMMVGMQDQMSKAWSNSNRRTDATREARAACILMARDLSTFAMRGKAFSRFDSFPTNLTNAGVPFYYYDGSGGLVPEGAPNCAQFFGLIPQASKTNDPADIALVGYYIAPATSTSVNGFRTTSYNLFRYYIAPSNAAAGIATWLSSPNGTATALFTNIATNSEILARNACNLQIRIYSGTTMNNGLNFSNKEASDGFYQGNKMGIELSFYPEDSAQKITSSAWMNTTNIQKYARSFEFKIDCPKD